MDKYNTLFESIEEIITSHTFRLQSKSLYEEDGILRGTLHLYTDNKLDIDLEADNIKTEINFLKDIVHSHEVYGPKITLFIEICTDESGNEIAERVKGEMKFFLDLIKEKDEKIKSLEEENKILKESGIRGLMRKVFGGNEK